MKVYKSYKWWCGFLLLTIGGLIQFACLPFADMSLLAGSCIFTILFSQILAIIKLGEVFMWKHDFVALILLPLGTATLVSVNK